MNILNGWLFTDILVYDDQLAELIPDSVDWEWQPATINLREVVAVSPDVERTEHDFVGTVLYLKGGQTFTVNEPYDIVYQKITQPNWE